MQDLSWYWRRITSMDASEIAWRVRSLVRDQLDSIRIPLGLIPQLQHKQPISVTEFAPGFQCSPVTHDDWEEPLSRTQKQWQMRLLNKANLILENRLSYFDLEAVYHGDPMNWHRDFSARTDSPVIQSLRTNYRDFKKFGDCKLVWEPNRHHQLVVLARAYVASNEKIYAEKVAELLRSWIDANPFGYGMNWKSPLEVGVRLINWVWAIDLIRPANVFGEELWRDVLQTVYLAMWDCERKFSQGSSANNHLIGEAAGVYVAACYFKQLPNSSRWQESSKEILEREIIAQTYADGCTREHAFGYQFFVIQFFLLCKRAGDSTDDPFSKEYRSRLLEMYRFMDEISADTGTPPNMGDADDGYVLDMGDLPRNTFELLSVGGHEFGKPELALSKSSETVFWIFGEKDQNQATHIDRRTSRFFAESGYAVLRSSRISVFFDCAELGYGPIAAHGHADCLSFCLSVDGRPIFIDPGTYDYFSYPEWREYFRKTRAHNTVEIDGRSQSQLLGPFMWGRKAHPSAIDWDVSSGTSRISAEHDGYGTLADPTVHRRTVCLDQETSTVIIDDKFRCKNTHEARTFFHLHPDCNIEVISESKALIRCDELVLELRSDGRQNIVDPRGRSGFSNSVSFGYHHKVESTTIELHSTISNSAGIQTQLSILPSQGTSDLF